MCRWFGVPHVVRLCWIMLCFAGCVAHGSIKDQSQVSSEDEIILFYVPSTGVNKKITLF